jgi:glycerate dehydrogenase
MKIVILDGGTLNPGDLSWDSFKAFGNVEVYDVTPADKVIERSKDADILIINKIVLDEKTISQLPQLKYIGVSATGYNVVDVKAARQRDIPVTNIPTYGTASVAQMVFALLLELSHHTGYHARTVKEGRWSACDNFCYWDFPLVELAGLTMGIVGYGRIGRATAALAEAFGMKTIAYDVYADQMTGAGVSFVKLDELFARSDVISLHCPLTVENKGMVNAERLGLMKKSAFLINTSRGPLINERDLAEALNSGQIAGAGLDVLSTEPPTSENPLLTAKNCYITPHIAWATHSARQRLMNTLIENLKGFIENKPKNVVS